MSELPSSEARTSPRGLRLENNHHDDTNELQARLSRIALSLVVVVVLGGGAGILVAATNKSLALAMLVSVVAGAVIAVLVALFAALSAVRTARPAPVFHQPPVAAQPRQAPVEPAAAFEQRPTTSAPLWDQLGGNLTDGHDDLSQRREVFVKLARRLQSLINRAIKRIDELEQENEDPVLLDGLYEVDHLFTLARRQGENLAVLGGESPQRRSNQPVSVYAVLLAAVSEAEHYRQIAIVPVEDVEIHGHAVAEIIHLLAELLENATRFTSPDGPKVEVRAHKVTSGLAIEVQDRGLGMTHEDLERINQLLDGSTRIDISELLEDGRIGLAVVRELGRRHNIRVRLQSNIFGGIAAAVVIPPQLLSEPTAALKPQQTQPPQAQQQRRIQPQPAPRERPPAISPAPTPPTPPPPANPVVQQAPVPSPAPRPKPSPQPHPADETELPVLPVRAPGHSYNELRTGKLTDVEETMPGPQADHWPPPLPQRRGTHLREELLEPPAPTAPVLGHNTRLMATVQEGRDNWIADQNRDADSEQQNQGSNRGESVTQWPTI